MSVRIGIIADIHCSHPGRDPSHWPRGGGPYEWQALLNNLKSFMDKH